MAIAESAVRQIQSEEGLYAFLSDPPPERGLGWPMDGQPQVYDFYADELGLKDAAGRIGRVCQFAPLVKEQPWGLFLIEFAEDRFYRTHLREVLRGLVPSRRRQSNLPTWEVENLLFLCVSPDYKRFTIAHFSGDRHANAKLATFGWSPEEPIRTLCELNLPALRWPDNPADSAAWLRQWAGAFDVEKVTSAFFKEYRRIFEIVEGRIEGVQGDKRLFTQRLFNRLMFVQFLSKKGWLRFQGRQDYLHALWEGRDRSQNFYRAHLIPLFFAGLNNQNSLDLRRNNPALYARIGDVPFLNGGLFEQAEGDEKGEFIPDEAFDLLFNGLFSRFNFTVTETTPLDIQVAVDPEMLGKVFEELVTQSERHSSGSYYTPRPIVSFMCREALKGYLGGYAELVDARNADNLSRTDARDLLDRLKAVKVVDPACGSGAYLLGMLHELYDLIGLLEVRADPMTEADKYKRKLDILQNNLYGVDNAEFAIQIARLRLWLSLVVEFNGETPPPLPNLDFKIEYGDSLAAPDPQGGAQPDMFRQEQIERFKALKARHMRAHDHEKQALHKEIARLRDEIAQGIHPGAQVEGFDWGVEFAEVFLPEKPLATIGGAFNFGQELAEQDVPGGFDIVLANPPYVKQQLIIEQKPTLQKVYPAVYTGTADLYCYFYARALQLLRPGGMLVFISSNKWFRAAYGAKLRKHIAETCRVESITDFGELPVFQNAATFPMIFVAQRIYSNSTPPPVYFTQVKSLEPPYPDVLTLIQRDGQPLPSNALHGADWTLTDSASADRLRKMEKAGVPLRQYVNGQIYRGVVTGLNSAFYITDAKRTELITQDPKSAEIIKPLAVGDNVRRWCINREKWFIVTHTGVDIVRYPAIFAHLQIQQYRLEKRWDKGKHWWELRSCVYYDAFDKPKIVYPDIGKEPRFTLDTEGHYLDATATCIANSDLYLLGLLNSKVVWEYVSSKCAILGDAEKGGRIRLKTFYVEQIPIPDAPQAERQAIAALVQCCLDAKGVGCEAWEKEIDARVAALYGLEL